MLSVANINTPVLPQTSPPSECKCESHIYHVLVRLSKVPTTPCSNLWRENTHKQSKTRSRAVRSKTKIRLLLVKEGEPKFNLTLIER